MEGSRFTAPFPGLRAFEPTQTDLFFGRDKEVSALITKLRAQRLVGVVGISGIGKSSLVRAGIIPWLEQGYMADVARRWRIITLKPGSAPLTVLARKLAACFGTTEEKASAELAHSSRGLLRFAADRLASDEALFILVDQFEELMRFLGDTAAKRQEAAEFIDLILGATGHGALEPVTEGGPRVFVILTMRSEYLGKCTRFAGLAEALNDGQFLVPRLERDQLKLAIEGPIAMVGARITAALTQALLNDAASEIDQLPLMQFALARMWEISTGDRARGEPLDLKHYQAVGGSIVQALNLEADDVVQKLRERDPKNVEVIERLLQRLVEPGAADEEVRRPAPLSDLAAVTEVSVEKLRPVVDDLVAHGILTLSSDDDPEVDITHESLIRRWRSLNGWAKAEAVSAEVYLRLAGAAARGAAPYSGRDLREALRWRKANRPSQAWAARYPVENGSFEKAMMFLDYSRRRRRVIGGLILAGALLVIGALGSVLYYQRQTQQHQQTVVVDRLFLQAQNLANGSSNLAQKSLLLGLAALKLQRSAYVDRFVREQGATIPILQAQMRHAEANSLTFTADGKRLISAGADKVLRLWDLASGNELAHADLAAKVADVRYDAASGYLATAAIDDAPAAGDPARQVVQFALWKIEDAALRGPLFRVDVSGTDTDMAFGAGRLWIADPAKLSSLRLDAISAGAEATPIEGAQLTFTSDGKYLLSTRAGTLSVRNLATGATTAIEVPEPLGDGVIEALLTSRDDTTVGVVCQIRRGAATTRRFFTLRLEPLAWQGKGVTLSLFDRLALSPDGRLVARTMGLATITDTATGTDLNTLTETLRAPSGRSWPLASFSGDGTRVALTTGSSAIRIFLLKPWREIGRIGLGLAPLTVTWSPDDQMVATAAEGGLITVWRLSDRDDALPIAANTFALSPSGRYSVNLTGSANGVLRDAENRELQRFNDQPFAFSPDERRFATVDRRQKKAKIFALPENRLVCTVEFPSDFIAAAFRGTGALMMVTLDGTLRSWTVTADGCTPGTNLTLGKFSNGVRAFFSPQGTRLATEPGDPTGAAPGLIADTSDKTVTLFDLEAGKPAGTIQAQAFRGVVFSPDDRLVTAMTKNGIKVWRAASGRELWHQVLDGGDWHPMFDPTGAKLAGGNGNVARVWDSESGKVLFEDGDESTVMIANGLAFDRDGAFLASARSNRVKVWDIGVGAQVSDIAATFDWPTVGFLGFSADNARLLVQNSFAVTTVRLFRWRTEDIIREGCDRVAFNLSPADWRRVGGFYTPTDRTCPTRPVRE